MFPLSLANYNQKYSVIKVSGNQDTKHFLENLGFVTDAEVEIVQSLNGNVIVNIKDSRIAINEDMAKHILVH